MVAGGVENGEGKTSVDIGTGKAEWNAGGERKTSFAEKIMRLMKVIGVLRFPVNPMHHLSARARQTLVDGSEIPCHESMCAECLRGYVILTKQRAIAVTQDASIVNVVLETKGCPFCRNMQGVPGDGWQEHGYFVFGEMAVHISQLLRVRVLVHGGTPITGAWRGILKHLEDDLNWMREHPDLANRVLDGLDDLAQSLLEVYLAFEALTDHPYEFYSTAAGYFPLITSCDGSNKLATNNMTLEKFLAERERQVVDMDLTACWLTLSMLSPMTFSKRLQFVYTTPMAFCRHNRKSNIFVIPARGPVGRNQDLEDLDYNELLAWVKERRGKSMVEALRDTNMESFKALYERCSKRNVQKTTTQPENIPLMRDMFTRLYDQAVREGGGSAECSKALMGRGSAAATGVEGFYSVPDGVQLMHMFLLRPEGPGEVADLFLFCKHLPILLMTDLMCRLGPTVEKKVPGVIKDEGALPLNGAGKVDIPSLATEGIHVGGSWDGRGRPQPEAKCTKNNVYNVLRDAGLSPRVQRGTNFAALLDLCAREGPTGLHGKCFADLARTLLRSLHRWGRYSVDLVEVVAVLNARVTAVVGMLEAEANEEAVDELACERSGLPQLKAYRHFSAHVLKIAGGFRSEEVPTLPPFYNNLRAPEIGEFLTKYLVPEMDQQYVDVRAEDRAMVEVMLQYSEEKEKYIAEKLGPDDDAKRRMAVQALRSGAAFGAAVHCSKFLQIWCSNGNPGESADTGGKVAGFSICFDIQPDAPSAERVPHPYNGEEAGPYFAPDHFDDFNHGSDCRRKYGMLDTCSQLAGVNCTVHEQNRAKKKKLLAMTNTMGFDRFSFMVTLINEIENEAINRRYLNALIESIGRHKSRRAAVCIAEISLTGRCCCDKPLQLRYDQFGRARLFFL